MIEDTNLNGELEPSTEYQIVNAGSTLTISCTFNTVGFLPYYKWKIDQSACSDCPAHNKRRKIFGQGLKED